MVDALALRGEEGRDYRRYATGSWKQALIRGSPNGETRQGSCPVIPKGRQTRGIETSKYPEEKKSKRFP